MANVFLQKKPIFFISLSIAKRLNAKVSKLEIGEKSPMNYFVTLVKGQIDLGKNNTIPPMCMNPFFCQGLEIGF